MTTKPSKEEILRAKEVIHDLLLYSWKNLDEENYKKALRERVLSVLEDYEKMEAGYCENMGEEGSCKSLEHICKLEQERDRYREALEKISNANFTGNGLQDLAKQALQAGKSKDICPHCGGLKAIRNPSGYCDHLYYPDNCNICKSKEEC